MSLKALEAIVAITAVLILAAWFRWGSPIRERSEPHSKPDDRGDLDELD